jgi:hypothetical protein
MAGKGSEEG